MKHRIDLYRGSEPVKLPNRRMPMPFKADLRQKIEKFLEHKPITPSHSLYSSPAVLVPKKNGKLRLVIDSRQLNKQTVKSCWPIPSVEEIFDTLERSCYFSTIDMFWGSISYLWKKVVKTLLLSVPRLVLSSGLLWRWVSRAVRQSSSH